MPTTFEGRDTSSPLESRFAENLNPHEAAERKDAIAIIEAAVDTWLANFDREGKPFDRQRMSELLKYLGTELAATVDRITAPFMDREQCFDRPAVKIYNGVDSQSPDIWVLGWRCGERATDVEGTEIHDHEDSEAAVYVHRGTVEEVIYAFDSVEWDQDRDRIQFRLARRGLSEGSTTTIPAPYIHDVNGMPEQQLGVTLHAYYPPLDAMNFYEAQGDVLVKSGRWEEEKKPHC